MELPEPTEAEQEQYWEIFESETLTDDEKLDAISKLPEHIRVWSEGMWRVVLQSDDPASSAT